MRRRDWGRGGQIHLPLAESDVRWCPPQRQRGGGVWLHGGGGVIPSMVSRLPSRRRQLGDGVRLRGGSGAEGRYGLRQQLRKAIADGTGRLARQRQGGRSS